MSILKRIVGYFLVAFFVMPIMYTLLVLLWSFIMRVISPPSLSYAGEASMSFYFQFYAVNLSAYFGYLIFLLLLVYEWIGRPFVRENGLVSPTLKWALRCLFFLFGQLLGLLISNLTSDLFHGGFEWGQAFIMMLLTSLLLGTCMPRLFKRN
jgi:hypothetical protein